eukprot:1595138-Pyramimonas_sp.AAC.1
MVLPGSQGLSGIPFGCHGSSSWLPCATYVSLIQRLLKRPSGIAFPYGDLCGMMSIFIRSCEVGLGCART